MIDKFKNNKRLIFTLLGLLIIINLGVKIPIKNNEYKIITKNKIKLYSEWPILSIETNKLNDNKDYIKNNCLLKTSNNNNNKINIENFDSIIKQWMKSKIDKCIYLLNIFELIYEINIDQNELLMSDKLEIKVKEWLLNDNNLIKQIKNQKLIIIYNKFTNEENVFNPLRQKKPQSKPDISPDKL
jgi:hypothetical protein